MKTFLSLLTAFAALSTFSIAAPAIGQPAPDFSLPDTHGKTQSLSSYRGKYVVLEWVNHGCPFVKKHYQSGNMQGLQKEVTGQDAVWLSICSSNTGKQGNMSADEWNKTIEETKTAATAVLLDTDGKTGREYGAKTTPQMFVIDPAGKLIYAGAIDDKPTPDKADIATAKNYVRVALEEAKAGKPVSQPETKSYGCGVKY